MTLLSTSIEPFIFSPRASLMTRPNNISTLIKDFYDTEWDIDNNHFGKVDSLEVKSLPLDVKETDTHYDLLVDAPGINKEDFKIEINDHFLTMSVEKKKVNVADNEKLKRVERYVGKSSRSLRLGEDVDEDKVEASYVDGVLHIKLAKKPTEALKKKVKYITIM